VRPVHSETPVLRSLCRPERSRSIRNNLHSAELQFEHGAAVVGVSVCRGAARSGEVGGRALRETPSMLDRTRAGNTVKEQ